MPKTVSTIAIAAQAEKLMDLRRAAGCPVDEGALKAMRRIARWLLTGTMPTDLILATYTRAGSIAAKQIAPAPAEQDPAALLAGDDGPDVDVPPVDVPPVDVPPVDVPPVDVPPAARPEPVVEAIDEAPVGNDDAAPDEPAYDDDDDVDWISRAREIEAARQAEVDAKMRVHDEAQTVALAERLLAAIRDCEWKPQSGVVFKEVGKPVSIWPHVAAVETPEIVEIVDLIERNYSSQQKAIVHRVCGAERFAAFVDQRRALLRRMTEIAHTAREISLCQISPNEGRYLSRPGPAAINEWKRACKRYAGHERRHLENALNLRMPNFAARLKRRIRDDAGARARASG